MRPDVAGSPVELIDRIFKGGLGEFDLVLAPTYGGMRYDLAWETLELLAANIREAT